MPSLLRALLRSAPNDPHEDPTAAPSAMCGPNAARRWTPQRFGQNQGIVYIVGLLFVPFGIQGIDADAPGRALLIARWALLAALCLWYLGSALIADLSPRFRWGYVAGFLLLTLATAEFQGWFFTNFSVYLTVMVAMLIPWRTARWVIGGWSLVVLLTALPAHAMSPVVMAAMGLLFGWACGGSIEAARVRRRLEAAEQRVATLALAAERERIARDLHDILGHSLTAISIKSGLAARLAEQDPDAARAQMTEVEQIARVALADVRATTSGLREVRLAGEIASARSVLMAAGVRADTPSAVPPMPVACSELLGYVVREAVTNVVRHADATSCRIEVGQHAVTVSDDGVGLRRGQRGGSGLAGLRRRLADAGGTLTVGPGPAGGTVLRAELAPGGAR